MPEKPDSLNTYRLRPALRRLPALVRKQRRLERRLVKAQAVVEQEKATRDAIDELLRAAGLEKSQGVTCLGYDVVHNERRGQARVNADKLRGAGVAEVDIQFATETGKASYFATVRPMKGVDVAAAAAPAPRAKAA